MPVVHYDWDELEDNIVEEYDESGNTIAEYTTKPTLYGDVISQHRDGQSHFFHYDGNGNTTEVTDINGNVTDTRQYTAFGEISESTGTTEFAFQFIGQNGYYRDEETASYSVRRRPYDPVIARWVTVDPQSDRAANVFEYAMNNPTNAIDPSGEFAWWPIACIAACGTFGCCFGPGALGCLSSRNIEEFADCFGYYFSLLKPWHQKLCQGSIAGCVVCAATKLWKVAKDAEWCPCYCKDDTGLVAFIGVVPKLICKSMPVCKCVVG